MSKVIFTIRPSTLPESLATVGEVIAWFHAEQQRMVQATAKAIVDYASALEVLTVADGDNGKSSPSAVDGLVH